VNRSIVPFLVAGLACAPQRTPVLAPVRVTVPDAAPATSLAPVNAIDDPFYTTGRIDWPGPNSYRTGSGSPGPEYWQQRADYTLSGTLDTNQQTVTGTVSIRYTNNSPDTLRFVWLQLDQNLYRPGSRGSAVNPADSRWGVRGFMGGMDLADVRVNGSVAGWKVNDTMMRIDLDTPIPPAGGRATIAMRFTFRVPEHGSDRMGRDGTLYEIAQWYPRMAVYDDIRGWNTDQYLGQGEFYLEYGDFDVSITAPAGYTIASSGMLQNPADVLTAEQRERLARAAHSSDVVPIIAASEAKAVATPGTRTWRFHAERVRDVAWAGAPDFRWDATSWNGVLAQSYYQFPRAGKAWEAAAEQTQWTIRHFSETFLPYPYPQATSVAGPVGGMEYPMFVMVHYGSDDPSSIFGTINHEQGHEWFPMIVGSNERRYPWQDEGFNTYIDAFAGEKRYPGTIAWGGMLSSWRGVVDNGLQSPLMTAADRIDRSALGAIGYRKPGAVLLTLRNHVVGRETFDRAFREYTRRWAFKHPSPADFFRTIENVSGEDLSWFWRGFFYTTDVLDIGVDSVSTVVQGDRQVARIVLHRHTSIPFPVSLRLKLADGTTRDVQLPVDIWTRGDRFVAELDVAGTVKGVRLWPDPSVPDWNADNDVWGDAPSADVLKPVTSGGLGPMTTVP
jgi:hypothetical protein